MKKKSELERIAPKVKSTLKVPEFKSDEEELAWLEKNHQRLAEIAQKHGTIVQFVKKEPTQQISIRVPVRDIEMAKKIGAKQNESYQSVMKRALRSGLANVSLL